MENFLNKINKHPSIKFDPKYSISDFEFIDVLIHKDEQKRLQTTLFKKKANKQTALLSLCSILKVKRFFQQIANSSAIAKYCESKLQKEVMTHLPL